MQFILIDFEECEGDGSRPLHQNIARTGSNAMACSNTGAGNSASCLSSSAVHVLWTVRVPVAVFELRQLYKTL